MWKIKVNNEFLDIPTDFAPQLNRVNPIFQTEGIIKDDYTLPIPLPHSDQNARILNYPGVIDNAQRFRPRYPAVLYWMDVPRIFGELRVTKVPNKDTISAIFVTGLSEVSADIRERKLRDIMDEEIVIHNTNFDKSFIASYVGRGVDKVEATINGIQYSEDSVADFINAVNDDLDQSASVAIVPDDFFTLVRFIPGSLHELDSFNVVFPVPGIDPDTETLRYTWSIGVPAFVTPYNEVYADFVDNYRGATPLPKIRFKTFANYDRFEDNNAVKRWPLVNAYNESGLLKNDIEFGLFFFTSPPETINQNSLSPQVTVRYVLQKIEEFFNISIEFPLTDEDPDNELVLMAPVFLDVPLKYLNGAIFNFYRRSFNIAELVPDITVNDFLKSIQGLGFYISYDSKARKVSFKERNMIAASNKYVDLKGKFGEIQDIVSFQKEGVTISHQPDSNNKYIEQSISPYSGTYNKIFGPGEKQISTRVSVPAYDTWQPRPAGLTEINGVAVSTPQTPEFRSVTLAYAPGYSDALTTHIVNGQSLAWDSEFNYTNGLWDIFWKEWIEMEDNTTNCRMMLYMPDFWVWNPMWTVKYLIDRNKYLIHSFEVVIQDGEHMEVDAKLVRVPYSQRSTLDTGGPISLLPGVTVPPTGFDYDLDFDLE